MIHPSQAGQEQPSTSLLPTVLTETFKPADRGGISKLFKRLKKEELSGLVSHRAIDLVQKWTVTHDANMFNGRFFLSPMATKSSNRMHKARFVVPRHHDKEKHMMVHNSSTIQPASVRLLVSVPAMSTSRLWSLDVTKAYVK